jgi:hypothetical protein
LPILDFACGGGHRTVEFIKMFNLENNPIFAYDTNNEWESMWKENLSSVTNQLSWLSDLPDSWKGIIHFSHGFYMPSARDQCLSLYESSDCNNLFVRGYGKSSIFNQVISAWDIPDNANWDTILKDKIRDKNWDYFSFRIPTTSLLKDNEVKPYSETITEFVDKSGSSNVVEDFIKQHSYKGDYKIDNSDILYHIMKKSLIN